MSQFPYTTPQHQGPPKTSGMAITALVLSLIGLLLSIVFIGIVPAIIGLILGIVALGQIDERPGGKTGRGLAVGGISVGALAILVSLIIVPILILLPALGAARKTARQMQNNTQVRGIHHAAVIYSQSNRNWYPGIDKNGDPADTSTENRFGILLDGNYFTGEYLISPTEQKTVAFASPLTTANYSYALLDVSRDDQRRQEWRDTLNTQAAVISDRNAGNASDVYSIHTGPGDGWRGSVGYNDNHVNFATDHILTDTRYGNGLENPRDDLFRVENDADAMMIYSGGDAVDRE